MTYYINSGHTLALDGKLFHSGMKIGSELENKLKSSKSFDKLINREVIIDKEPQLDSQVDKQSGSKNLNKVTVPEKAPKVELEQAQKEQEQKEQAQKEQAQKEQAQKEQAQKKSKK